jgi:hypothetical protein
VGKVPAVYAGKLRSQCLEQTALVVSFSALNFWLKILKLAKDI